MLLALATDLLLLIGFAALGRGAHDEGSAIGGTLTTAAPFLIGYTASALATRLDRDPLSVRRAVSAWAPGIILGLLLRRLVFDRGIALPFVIVALAVTGLMLLGWRLLLRHRRPA